MKGEWRVANSGCPFPTRNSLFATRSPSRRRLARLAAQDHAVDRGARRRPGEQETLHLVAAGEPQQDALLLGLDALAQHGQPERAAERHDRLDDHAAVGGAAERRNELLVDLELVDREAAQV